MEKRRELPVDCVLFPRWLNLPTQAPNENVPCKASPPWVPPPFLFFPSFISHPTCYFVGSWSYLLELDVGSFAFLHFIHLPLDPSPPPFALQAHTFSQPNRSYSGCHLCCKCTWRINQAKAHGRHKGMKMVALKGNCQINTRKQCNAMQCKWGVLLGGELMSQERRQQRELSSASGLIACSICNELEKIR